MTKTFKVDGMSCMHCVSNIKTAFSAMDCVSNAEVSLGDASMTLTYDENRLSEEAICDKVAELGYTCVI